MKHCVLVILCLGFMLSSTGQEEKSFFFLPLKKQAAFLKAVNDKFRKLDDKIIASTSRSLSRLKKQEQKIYRKLYKKDSVAAKAFLANSQDAYLELETKLNDAATFKQLKEYVPPFDTLKSSLRFLNKSINRDYPFTDQLGDAEQSLKQFESRMQIANEIKRQLKERKKQIAEQLQQFGLVKEMKKLNKEMFYYQEQLKEYKALLKDPKKAEQKAIAALRNSKAFKDFMKKNSMLAQLFKVPDNYGTPESLAGLQTTSSVSALLQQRFAGAGSNPREYAQQQLTKAQSEMNKLQKKVKDLTPTPLRGRGASSSDIEMPDNFKPNTQKTKSFLKRLEYGANFQTHRPNNLLPVTSDLALSVGYKLNDKSIIGIGASYKLGLGNGIENLKLTSEGVGLRSFIDIKASFGSSKGGMLGSLWITGGYEQNYYQSFGSLEALYNINAWKQSALLGLTKKVKLKNDKSGKVQLLYDFFYQTNNIRTQPLMFRIEYGF